MDTTTAADVVAGTPMTWTRDHTACLVDLRARRGISQVQLANEAGVSATQVSRAERGLHVGFRLDQGTAGRLWRWMEREQEQA